jgi:hypothetical protein
VTNKAHISKEQRMDRDTLPALQIYACYIACYANDDLELYKGGHMSWNMKKILFNTKKNISNMRTDSELYT